MEQPSCFIDELGPLPVEAAASVMELQDTIRRAGATAQAVYPLGGRTQLHIGFPPTKAGLAVDLTNLDQIIDYPARDMTITVQAGTTIAKLQAILAKEKQRLPIDVPHADRATLGGILATNTSGPRRYGYGTLRDYVIGISAVNDQGEEIKAGGRVVKNVAGYDLCKLFVGSLGTLGIITQVTLKLRPVPEESAFVALGCEADSLEKALDRLHSSRTRPVCVAVLNGAAADLVVGQTGLSLPDKSWLMLVGFEDNRTAVDWQVEQLNQEAQTALPCFRGAAAEALWHALNLCPSAILSFQVNSLPSATASLCRQIALIAQDVVLQAHAGNGIVIGHVVGDLTADRAGTMLTVLQEAAAAAQGNVVVLRCPPAWKSSLPIWGRPRGDWELMKAVKDQLDPGRLFNPGRFVNGI